MIKLLWEEWLVTAQCSAGGRAPSLLPQAAYVPAWFKLGELGLGEPWNGTVFDTMARLPAINARNRRELAERESPEALERAALRREAEHARLRSARMSAKDRAKHARRLLRAGGMDIRGGAYVATA